MPVPASAIHRLIRPALIILLIGYWMFAVWMTHTPRLAKAGISVGDKTLHAVGYGSLAALLLVTLWVCRPTMKFTALVVLMVLLAYGVLDEITQRPFGRTPDLRDWIADGIGAAIAVAFLWIVRRFVARRPVS